MQRGSARRIVLALVVGSALVLTSCGGSSGGTGSRSDRSRGADENAVPAKKDWDLEAHVILTNHSTSPYEVGLLANKGPAGNVLLSASPPSTKAAGDATALVVPAATGTAKPGSVDLYLQMKSSNGNRVNNQNYSPKDDPPQDVLVVLPTTQLHITLTHGWKAVSCTKDPDLGNFCDWLRTNSVTFQTRTVDGYQAPISQILQCVDPTTVTGDFDPTKYSQTISPDAFNTITVDVRSGETMAGTNCGGDDKLYTGLDLPGLSLAPATTDGAVGSGIDLAKTTFASAQLPGVDLSYANLSSTKFVRGNPANLAYADLSNANLTGAVLTGADLTGANLDGASLTGTNLEDAVLFDVDLSKTTGQLVASDVDSIKLCRTTLPPPGGLLDKVNPNKDCPENAGGVVPPWAPGAVLVNTTSPVPLVLVSIGGNYDCPRRGQVGPHTRLALPPASCSSPVVSVYGSSRIGTDGKGGDASITDAAGRGGVGALHVNTSGPNGYLGMICMSADVIDGTCPEVIPPKPTTS